MADVILQALFIYGLAIVISMLAAVMIRGIVLAVAAAGGRRRSEPQAAPPPPVAAGPPAHHVAAITAAIAAMGGRQRVVRIEPGRTTGAWISEGRLQQQTSHKTR
ncbi:MAG: hypothetical protein H6907_15540 [Hyphomicrobiales bacterium]|nr:hypothetical protein [Hyphomicrobiales bacterium]